MRSLCVSSVFPTALVVQLLFQTALADDVASSAQVGATRAYACDVALSQAETKIRLKCCKRPVWVIPWRQTSTLPISGAIAIRHQYREQMGKRITFGLASAT